MVLVKPSFEIVEMMGVVRTPLELIEFAGRTCYKSEDKITEDSARSFVAMLTKRGHHSVLEHSAMAVKFVIDRGVSHELVRHRLCAFSQESTRYCNYKGEVTFVIPSWISNIGVGEYNDTKNHYGFEHFELTDIDWFLAMKQAEETYQQLLRNSWSPQQARSVLPNSLKTEIVVTANLREWKHILTLRCSKAAHPQMREIMFPLLEKAKTLIPIIFDDIKEEEENV